MQKLVNGQVAANDSSRPTRPTPQTAVSNSIQKITGKPIPVTS